MTQKVLTKYWLMLHVAVLLSAAWVSTLYTSVGWVVSLLWLSLFALQAFLLLPSMLRGETMSMARLRAWSRTLYDPFVYVGIALIGVACIQWLNSGCSLIYVEDTEIWRYSAPPMGGIPFSIEPFPALITLSLFVASVVGGVIFRNGMGKASKRIFLGTASMLSGCIATYMVVMGGLGLSPYSDLGISPNLCNWGTFFGFWMLIALGGQLSFLHTHFFKTLIWALLSLSGNLLGMLQFETPLGIALFATAAVVMLGYFGFTLLRQSESGFLKLKQVAVLFLVVSVSVGAFMLFPEHPVKAKAAMLVDSTYVETILDDREFRSSIAWKMWQEHPWTGVGVGGFGRYGETMIIESDWMKLKGAGGTLSNDWLQFLAEYGVIGIALFVALVIILTMPLFARLRFIFQRLSRKTQEGEVASIDPYVVAGITAVLTVLLGSVLLSPLQSVATFVSFIYVLAIIPGLLPAAASNDNNN